MPRVVVYLRFARPRNGIKDPPLVHWDSAKEQELWTMLRTSSADLNWSALAERFDVPVVYILQQAAWLYEKELGLLRQKMSEINLPPSASTPPHPPRRVSADLVTPQRMSEVPSARTSPFDELDDSSSEFAPTPSRRLLSTSRILPPPADSESESDSEASMDAFLPGRPRLASQPGSELSSSFSDNSVSQSALEEALLERDNERGRRQSSVTTTTMSASTTLSGQPDMPEPPASHHTDQASPI